MSEIPLHKIEIESNKQQMYQIAIQLYNQEIQQLEEQKKQYEKYQVINFKELQFLLDQFKIAVNDQKEEYQKTINSIQKSLTEINQFQPIQEDKFVSKTLIDELIKELEMQQ